MTLFDPSLRPESDMSSLELLYFVTTGQHPDLCLDEAVKGFDRMNWQGMVNWDRYEFLVTGQLDNVRRLFMPDFLWGKFPVYIRTFVAQNTARLDGLCLKYEAWFRKNEKYMVPVEKRSTNNIFDDGNVWRFDRETAELLKEIYNAVYFAHKETVEHIRAVLDNPLRTSVFWAAVVTFLVSNVAGVLISWRLFLEEWKHSDPLLGWCGVAGLVLAVGLFWKQTFIYLAALAFWRDYDGFAFFFKRAFGYTLAGVVAIVAAAFVFGYGFYLFISFILFTILFLGGGIQSVVSKKKS